MLNANVPLMAVERATTTITAAAESEQKRRRVCVCVGLFNHLCRPYKFSLKFNKFQQQQQLLSGDS